MLIFTFEIESKGAPRTKADFLKEAEGAAKEVNNKNPYLPSYITDDKDRTKNSDKKASFFSKEMYRLIASFLLDMPMSVVCRKMDTLPEVEREALTAAIWDEYHERCSPLKPL